MGETIRKQSFIVDKLSGMSDEIVSLVPPNNPSESVVSICFFSPSSDPHYMELAPEQSDSAVTTWPSANFEKGEWMHVISSPANFTLKVGRHHEFSELTLGKPKKSLYIYNSCDVQMERK